MTELRRLDARTMVHLLPPCGSCAFWETGPSAASRQQANPLDIKHDWIDRVTREWGPPGWITVVNDSPVGFVSYAPAAYAPRLNAFPTAPIAADSVALLMIRVVEEHRGRGIGADLLRAAEKDVIRHRVRAMEAFGTRSGMPVATGHECLPSAAFLMAMGFHIVRDHPTVPRFRLDLRTVLTWRSDVTSAAERLLAGIRRPVTGTTPVGETRVLTSLGTAGTAPPPREP